MLNQLGGVLANLNSNITFSSGKSAAAIFGIFVVCVLCVSADYLGMLSKLNSPFFQLRQDTQSKRHNHKPRSIGRAIKGERRDDKRKIDEFST